jgi:hypothetical protein
MKKIIFSIDFPHIIYTREDLSNWSREEIWQVWIKFIIEVCKAIDTNFEADASEVKWDYSSRIIGYFDYEVVSIQGFLADKQRKKSINFIGEADLKFEDEGKDCLGFYVKFMEGKLEGKIYYLEAASITHLFVYAEPYSPLVEKLKAFLKTYGTSN